MKLKDLTGMKFHSLLVLYRAGSNRGGKTTWLCLCDCGNKKIFSGDHLTRTTKPVKSCGCQQRKRGNKNPLWNGCGEISGNWWYNHVLRERSQAVRERVPVAVTIEFAWDLFLKQNRKCALSGQDIFIGDRQYGTASIDRIDSSKGYEEGNIQWVHKDINFMKRTYSMEYFIEMCRMVSENNM